MSKEAQIFNDELIMYVLLEKLYDFVSFCKNEEVTCGDRFLCPLVGSFTYVQARIGLCTLEVVCAEVLAKAVVVGTCRIFWPI